MFFYHAYQHMMDCLWSLQNHLSFNLKSQTEFCKKDANNVNILANLFCVARLACGERVIVVRTSPSEMQAVTKYKFEKLHNATEALRTPHCTLQKHMSLY